MKLLLLSWDLSFPPRDGMNVHTVEVFGRLAGSHACDLIAYTRHGVDESRLPFRDRLGRLRVFPQPRRIGAHLALSAARACGLLGRGDFAATVDRALEMAAYDVVVMDGIGLFPYLGRVLSRPVVFSLVDAPSLRFGRLSGRGARPASRAYAAVSRVVSRLLERRVLERAAVTHVVSPVDAAYLRALRPRARVVSAGLPVPDAFFDDLPRPADAPVVVSVLGDLRVEHIRSGIEGYLRDVHPELLRACPDVRLRIVGAGATAFLAGQPGAGSVVPVDWVDHYPSELGRADVVAVPDPRGTGLKSRVLQAMAAGRPVVGTPAAWEGIPVERGVDGFLASSTSEFARCLIALVRDPSLRGGVGERARARVRRLYSAEAVGEAWADLLREVRGAD